MVLTHDGIAMNVHAGGIALDEDSTTVCPRAAIACDDTASELAVERCVEVKAGALARRSVQSVVGNAATPHAQRASLAPDPAADLGRGATQGGLIRRSEVVS